MSLQKVVGSLSVYNLTAEKKEDFLTAVVLPWPAFLLSEHWRLGAEVESVQVVQVFLFYFCPESVPLLGTFPKHLWFPFCQCNAEGPEAEEQVPSQKLQSEMPWVSRDLPAQTGRDNALEGEAVGPCREVFAC